MPAYNFQAKFAPLVESGEKRQTIRAIGKRRHARPGERVQLYTGMRTKACRKLVTPDPVCTKVLPIRMEKNQQGGLNVDLDGVAVNALRTAEADGFRTAHEMLEFFERTHGLPFEGVLIRWEASDA
ncbi:MAG: hypothetical protein AB7E32_14035 [Desulfovibrio sp.]